jgi:hypothetical protein
MLEGGCLCGEVRFRITGKLGPLAYCHCKMCQRASGSAFAANASVRTRHFRPFGHFWASARAPWHSIEDALPQYAEGTVPEEPRASGR